MVKISVLAGCSCPACGNDPPWRGPAAPLRFVMVSQHITRFRHGASGHHSRGNRRFYAVLHTQIGDKKLPPIKIKLFHTAAPETVTSFIGLAKGLKTWFKNGRSMINVPFYQDLIFHRVIRGFMIQTGDPTGTGTGGPGFVVKDEFKNQLRFDNKGMVGMAHAGPGTAGSQFFITVNPAKHLNGKYTIFGEVVEGYKSVERISRVRTDRLDRPRKPVKLIKVDIISEK